MSERGPGNKGGPRGEKGHSIRGSASEGAGGTEEKTHVYQHPLNQVEESVVRGWGIDPHEHNRATLREEDRSNLLPVEQAMGGLGRESGKRGETSEQGRMAGKSNLGTSS
ncbi:hypothetical protein N0V88_003375 [Collariella sp. IMI 366227]|nr:hypothetical protein N0V88_003375 [Collariella sp. IMI 366227]